MIANFSLQQRKLAPGSYDIKDFLQLSEEKPRSILGICQTRDQRFKDNVAAVSENIKERASISGKSILKNIQFCKHEKASISGKSIFKNMQFCKHALTAPFSVCFRMRPLVLERTVKVEYLTQQWRRKPRSPQVL